MTQRTIGRIVGWVALAIILSVMLFVSGIARASEAGKEWVCHPVGSASGGNTHAGYSLIPPDKASSHLDEQGNPKHEHDGRVDVLATFNENGDPICPGQEGPALDRYRVLASMPKYRSPVFYAEPGLTCAFDLEYRARTGRGTWYVDCGDGNAFSGAYHTGVRPFHSPTFVRLKDLTTGEVTVYTGKLHA